MNERSPQDDLQRAYGDAREAQSTCPATEEIRRFRQNELGEERAAAVEFHLSDCAECIELMERLEPAEEAPPIGAAEESRLEREIAARLGLRREPARSGWRDALSRLWDIRTPLFVPAAAALLLVLVLVLRSGPTPGPPMEPATGILPVKSILIDQSALRSAGAEPVLPVLSAGDVVLVELFLDGLVHQPGDPVRYSLIDGEGHEWHSGETAVLENYDIRVVIQVADPGSYSLRLTSGDGGELLETVPLDVLPIVGR